MARKSGRKRKAGGKKVAVPRVDHIDATPERLAKATDGADGMRLSDIEDGIIEKAGERPPLVRRFRDSHIERMRLRGHLTYAQWFTADWYRTLHASAMTAPRVVAGYGEGLGGAGLADYGMARTLAQVHARETLRKARAIMPSNMLALVEKLVIDDEMPALRNGQERSRFGARIGAAIQPLAEWIRAPGCP